MRLGRIGHRLEKLEPIRILAIGSSSTQGVGASTPAHAYPALLEADLRARWPKLQVSVMNAGIGGETVGATLDRLERLLATQGFDLVIWQLGTNDAVRGSDAEAFRKLTLRGVAAGRAAGVDLILLDPQYFPGIRDLSGYERFVSTVKEVGDGEHVPVFQRYAMMKQWSAQGDAELIAALAPDRFHMNDKGYGCLAAALTAEIGRMTEPSSVAAAPAVALTATK
ncbi:MAG: SGNH/GDSL hydrolase family protein [Hyphomicrobiales bacterium]